MNRSQQRADQKNFDSQAQTADVSTPLMSDHVQVEPIQPAIDPRQEALQRYHELQRQRQMLENWRRQNNPTIMERVQDILSPGNWFG